MHFLGQGGPDPAFIHDGRLCILIIFPFSAPGVAPQPRCIMRSPASWHPDNRKGPADAGPGSLWYRLVALEGVDAAQLQQLGQLIQGSLALEQ